MSGTDTVRRFLAAFSVFITFMDSLSRESKEPCAGRGEAVFFRWGQRAESRGTGGRPDPAMWAGQAAGGTVQAVPSSTDSQSTTKQTQLSLADTT